MAARLKNKTILVTGSAQGIGLASAQAFLAEGAKVIATDINLGPLKNSGLSGNAEIIPLDVTDAQAIKQLAIQNPEVSVLMNCAGTVCNGAVLDCTIEDMKKSFALNVFSIYSTIQAFLPAMLERAQGSIINIASVVSTVTTATNRFAYSASKGAVIALTRSVARDYIESGVRCNAISPGTVYTPSLEERISATDNPDATRKMFIDRQPMKRLGRAEEIASAAVYLASDESAFTSGENLVIDGGFSL